MTKYNPAPYLVLFFIGSMLFSCDPTEQNNSTTLFTTVPSEKSHIDFVNKLPESPGMNSFVYEYFYNGGGVAAADFNNDGLKDLYFTANLVGNSLYLNQGDFEFEDVTRKANAVGINSWTNGVSVVDINNDGMLDIYLSKSGNFRNPEQRKNELLLNMGVDENGIPQFKERAANFGLDNAQFSMQSAFFDYDLDGDLDMYLLNHIPTKGDSSLWHGGRYQSSSLGDRFYVNENGYYYDRTQEVGIFSNGVSYGLGIGISDLNQDGWPDIYISNDYEEHDYCYINNKNGTFREVVKIATNQISNFSMGNDVADYNNDGFTDIVVLDMASEDNYGQKTSMPSMNPEKFYSMVNNDLHYQYMFNMLHKHSTHIDSLGTPFFSNTGQIAGISKTDWSWAPLLADYDNDGLKDLFITNGIKRDFRNNDYNNTIQDSIYKNNNYLKTPETMMQAVLATPNKPAKNYFFKNTNGTKFENQDSLWISDQQKNFSNGAAYADLDNDGDLDLIINNVDSKATILKNNAQNNYISLMFYGDKKNPHGVGAKISVYHGGNIQFFENYPVRGYLSSVPNEIIAGIGKATTIDSVSVEWPGGNAQTLKQVEINSRIILRFEESTERVLKIKNEPSKLFFNKTTSNIQHIENNFDDYQKQVLLPHKMSEFGPDLVMGDANNDGLDDVFIPQSSGTASQLFLQNKDGSFTLGQSFKKEASFEDVTGIFLDTDNDGDQDLMVVTGGNEFDSNSPMYQDRLYQNNKGTFVLNNTAIPSYSISGSKVKKIDFNSDGRMDLIVAGAHVPGAYPKAANSKILMNDGNQFIDKTDAVCPQFNQLGMVRDFEITDIDGDGDLDIIAVGEWMSPTLFINNQGKFSDLEYKGKEQLSGWYYAVKSVDIDNDGDQDLLLGNLGLNYKYKANDKEPFEVYYGDFDDNGQNDIVLGYYNFGSLYPVRGKQCSSQQMPSLKSEIKTYHDFGSKTLPEIYSEDRLAKGSVLKAYNFASGVLINEGQNKFTFKTFPDFAQLSSINSILTKDFNQDGLEDVIVAGNLFSSEIETPRNDAGYGMVLLNKGNGSFTSMDAHQSGLFIPYDVKSIEWIQLNNQLHMMVGIHNKKALTYQIK